MPKSRSQRESIQANAEQFGREREPSFVGPPRPTFSEDRDARSTSFRSERAESAYELMSRDDKNRISVGTRFYPYPDSQSSFNTNVERTIQPGSFTTKPGGDIQNSRTAGTRPSKSGNVNQNKLLKQLEESNRPSKPAKKKESKKK